MAGGSVLTLAPLPGLGQGEIDVGFCERFRTENEVMQRDMVLIRKIVTLMASDEVETAVVGLKDVDSNKFGYHAQLLIDAGLAVGSVQQFNNFTYKGQITRLTWEGHEFAQLLQDDSVWKKYKSKVIDTGTAVTIAMAKEMLTNYARENLGLPV